MTDVYLPILAAPTPGGGAYLNESDFLQPDWSNVFYGINYRLLRDVKRKYDPEDVFYASTAVGSDEWWQVGSGFVEFKKLVEKTRNYS